MLVEVLGLPLVVCLVTSAILGYIGIHVLKREIIFIDIALAQVAAVGAIAAHILFHESAGHGNGLMAKAMAYVFVLAAAGFFSLARRRVTEIPIEAVIGVSYAISAAAALFLLGAGTGGHVHVQDMLAGSLLWVTEKEILVACPTFAVVGILFWVFRRPLTEISEDYDAAIVAGRNVILWDFVFYALCGLVITLAVSIAGVVVVFAFLIIPATISAFFSSTWGARLFVAWSAGVLASILGLLFALKLDFSVGPAVALFLGIFLVCAAFLKTRASKQDGWPGFLTCFRREAAKLAADASLATESPTVVFAAIRRGIRRSVTKPALPDPTLQQIIGEKSERLGGSGRRQCSVTSP